MLQQPQQRPIYYNTTKRRVGCFRGDGGGTVGLYQPGRFSATRYGGRPWARVSDLQKTENSRPEGVTHMFTYRSPAESQHTAMGMTYDAKQFYIYNYTHGHTAPNNSCSMCRFNIVTYLARDFARMNNMPDYGISHECSSAELFTPTCDPGWF